MIRWPLIMFLLVGLIPARLEAGDRWALGMEELHRVDLLPRLRPSVYVGSVSSYDRSGGNDDGFSGKHSFVAREDDALVIADLEGPGMIYRIWTPTPTDDVVEFYFDGETTIHGTGSEDFFNGGWYDVPGRWEKRLSFPLSGCLGYQEHLGRTGGYRLMLGDAYAFRQSIRHTIEHAPTENSLETDYCAVTFFYLREPPTFGETLPSADARKVVDFERIVFTPSWAVPIHAFTFRGATLSKMGEKINGKKVAFLRLRAEGQDWFGPPFVSLVCEIPAPGRYTVSIEAVKGPEQAQVQLFRNEAPAGAVVDLYAPERARSKPVAMGTLSFEEGSANLMFKLVGKNEQSRGLGFDLITIQCERAE